MKSNLTHPVSAWEQAIADRNDIEFIEVRFKERAVTGVNGYILVRGTKRPALWRSDGRCYYRGRHAKSYDIKL